MNGPHSSFPGPLPTSQPAIRTNHRLRKAFDTEHTVSAAILNCWYLWYVREALSWAIADMNSLGELGHGDATRDRMCEVAKYAWANVEWSPSPRGSWSHRSLSSPVMSCLRLLVCLAMAADRHVRTHARRSSTIHCALNRLYVSGC